MSRVITMDGGIEAMRRAFNDAADKPRLLMLVSPTCGLCRQGASIMQTEVLEQMDSPLLRVFAGWVPILPEDSERAARESAGLVPDARAAHFWDANKLLPGPFASTLGLPEGWPAWDVYLTYPAGAVWSDEPSTPSYWEHQLGDGPAAPVLDGARFREQLRRLIEGDGS